MIVTATSQKFPAILRAWYRQPFLSSPTVRRLVSLIWGRAGAGLARYHILVAEGRAYVSISRRSMMRTGYSVRRTG